MYNSTRVIIGVGQRNHPAGHSFRREPGFPYWTLGCLLKGHGQVEFAGQTFKRRAVSLALTPPNTPYYLVCPVATRTIWVVFTPPLNWQPWLNWGHKPNAPQGYRPVLLTDPRIRARIIRGLNDVVEYSQAGPTIDSRLIELALEQVLVLTNSVATQPDDGDARMEKVIQAIRQTSNRPWRNHELARIAGLSPSRFAHLFRNRYILAPAQYVSRLRMEKAKTLLLSTNTPVKIIAAEVGFPDPLHFSARFRHEVGCSPLQFRQAGA